MKNCGRLFLKIKNIINHRSRENNAFPRRPASRISEVLLNETSGIVLKGDKLLLMDMQMSIGELSMSQEGLDRF